MATYKKQTIKDTTVESVIKLVGIIDGAALPASDPANTTIIVSNLVGARDSNGAFPLLANSVMRGIYNTKVKKVNYVVNTDTLNGSISLNWKGSTSNSVLATLQGAGTIDFEQMGGLIPSDALGVTGNSGDIFVSSNGVLGGSYTLIVHLKKTGTDFSAGENVDVATITGRAPF